MWCRQQDGGHGSWNPHKECVTTHLQNHIAPKTDGAQAVTSQLFYSSDFNPTLNGDINTRLLSPVGGTKLIGTLMCYASILLYELSHFKHAQKWLPVRDHGAAYSADLGTSSKESY